MKIKDVSEYLDNRFPQEFALEFDKAIGLAIGEEDTSVSNILLALDLTEEVIKDAISKNCNLIITHHPFLFTPLYKILFNDEKGKLIKLMIENKISLYSMHTNLDVADGGVNDVLASMVGIEDVKVINGVISKGNFLRYGNIKETTLGELAQNIKSIFNLDGVRILGDLNKKVKTIGIVGGSGAHDSDLLVAKEAGCDCYITGEVRLNNSQYAHFLDLSLIEVSHGVEKFVFYSLKEELEKTFKTLYDFDGNVTVTNISTDNMKYL